LADNPLPVRPGREEVRIAFPGLGKSRFSRISMGWERFGRIRFDVSGEFFELVHGEVLRLMVNAF
jgi:hypothetical protein